jgi:hypothetical protein
VSKAEIPFGPGCKSAFLRGGVPVRGFFVSTFFALTTVATAPVVLAQPASGASHPPSRAATGQQRVRPTGFVENLGQAPEDVLWQAKGAGFEASFSRDSFVLRLFGARPEGGAGSAKPMAAGGGVAGPPKLSDSRRISVTEQRISLAGASPQTTIEPLDPLPGKMNFFRGNNPKRWVRGLPTYARLRYKNVYPGVDLLFYSNQGALEYDFVVAPGANPRSIRMRVEDGRPVRIVANGALQVGEGAEAVLHRPLLYQNLDSGKHAVKGRFVRLAGNTVGFQFRHYDASRTLVIDPTLNLLYSTYFGGPHDDESTAIAVGANGNAYILGWSGSTDYPVSSNAYQPERALQNAGVLIDNMVLTKMSPSGSLLFSTFLGGSTGEKSGAIALDAAGNAYVTGTSMSTDYPVTAGAYEGKYPAGAATSLVVSEISPDGSALLYSTFFGGAGGATAAVDGGIALYQGNLYFGGSAGPGLPTTTGSYLTQINSGQAAFVAALNPAQTGPAQLVASTYYGAANPAANSVATGNLVLSMALDSSGNPWIAGQTYTNNLPTTAKALQPTLPALSASCIGSGANLNSAAYLAHLSSNLQTLMYASYLSGQKSGAQVAACSEYAHALALDPSSGSLYVAGATASASFPTTGGVVQGSYPGSNTYVGFVAKLSSDGTAKLWSSYLGGNLGYTFPSWLAIDNQGNPWVGGLTQGGSNFPISAVTYQSTQNGSANGNLTEFSSDGTQTPYSTYIGGSLSDFVQAFGFDAQNNIYITGDATSRNFPVTANAFQPLFANGDPVYDGGDVFFSILGTGVIGSVGPASGTNVGDATVAITGSGFQSGAACALVNGGVTIDASAAVVNASGTSINCTFPLSGAATGAYSVVITNPGGAAIQDAGAFTVTAGSTSQPGQPVLWSGVISRPAIRTGVPSGLEITYGNSGTVDAYMAVVWIVLPSSLTYSTSGVLSANDANCAALSSLPIGYTLGSSTYVPLLIPILPAGSSYSLPIAITSPANSTGLLFEDYTEPGWFDSISNTNASLSAASSSPGSVVQSCVSSASDPGIGNCFGVVAAALVPGVVSYFSAYGVTDLNAGPHVNSELATLLQGILSAEVASGNVGAPYSWMQIADQAGIDLLQGHGVSNQCSPANVTANLASRTILGYGVGGSSSGAGVTSMASRAMLRTIVAANLASRAILGRNSAGRLETPGELSSMAQASAEGAACSGPPAPFTCLDGGASCSGELAFDDDSSDGASCSSSGGSIDPNAKTGPVGDGTASAYIRTTSPFPYGVFFENQPAAQVVIADQLDPAKVDLTTVKLGTFAFGTNIITLPLNTSDYNTTFRINSSLSVRIQGGVNTDTGLLTWTFTSIDPTTGLPPSDPTVGFLPPDVNGVEGQGSVTFTVKAKSNLTTGTQIANQATVVFDANAPIGTPTWLNTIDVTPPVSAVATLPVAEATAMFPVSWSGSDVGSGIAFYSIYVSDNFGPFTAWLSQTAATTASYSGQAGHTYGFYSIATDLAGNIQAPKASADASTTVAACTYALSAGGQTFPAAGGAGSVGVVAGSGCPWTASSAANWITFVGSASGTGNGSVTYQAAANSSGSRSGVLTVAGLPFTVEEAAPLVVATSATLLSGFTGGAYAQDLSATGGVTPYTWTLVSGALPAGLAISGAAIAGTPTTAGTFTFTLQVADAVGDVTTLAFSLTVVSVSGSSALTRVGVLPQFAAGGSVATTIWVVNTSPSTAVPVSLVFHGDDGTLAFPAPTPLTVTQQGDTEVLTTTTVDRVLNPNTTLVINAGQNQTVNVQGWVDVLANSSVSGFAIFTFAPDGLTPTGAGYFTPWEATVPLQSQLSASTMTLPFINNGGFTTGIAIGSLTGSPASITATFFGLDGNPLPGSSSQTITLPANGHTAFLFNTGPAGQNWSFTSGQQGIVEFTGSSLMGLGLRVSPYSTETALPTILQ